MRLLLLLLPALMLTVPAAARQVDHVGSDATFDIATWNVEWFGSTGGGPTNEPLQFANVRRVIEQAGIDLWALQEVVSNSAFAALVDSLGAPWAGDLGTLPTGQQQRMAFLYRTDVVQKLSVSHELVDFSASFAGRPPLVLRATIHLPDTSFTAVLWTVHMKCCSDTQSYDKRLDASQRMKARFDFTTLSTANLVLLGDLNDELLSSIVPGKPSPYQNFVTDPDDYRFLTMPLEETNVCTFCGGLSSTIDHILVSNELFGAAEAGSTDRLSSVFGISGFLANTSDHAPVYSILSPASTSSPVERITDRDGPALYPLPARGQVTVEFGEPRLRLETVHVVDLLGRTVLTADIAPGSRRAVLDVTGLPPGIYVMAGAGLAGTLLPVVR